LASGKYLITEMNAGCSGSIITERIGLKSIWRIINQVESINNVSVGSGRKTGPPTT